MPEKFIITTESFIGLYNIKKAPLRSALSKNSGGLLLHEGSVNRPDGIFRLRFVHADDDVDLRVAEHRRLPARRHPRVHEAAVFDPDTPAFVQRRQHQST